MVNITDYIDAARSYSDIRSDRALSKALNLSPAVIRGWRLGSLPKNDAFMVELAELGGRSPALALVDLSLMRAQKHKNQGLCRLYLGIRASVRKQHASYLGSYEH